MSTTLRTTDTAASGLISTLSEIERRYNELDHLMADPEHATDPNRLMELGRERAELDEIVSAFRELKQTDGAIADAEVLASDEDREMAELAAEELKSLRPERDELVRRVRALLVPKDPNDDKNVIVEIRAGTGGDEAALFAADLFRMYTRYAERQRWKVEVALRDRDRRRRLPRSHLRGLRDEAPTATCATRAASTASSACRPPRARAGSTPRPPASRCCRRRKRSTSRSTTTTCGSTSTARPGTAARASTRPTRPCGSRTCRPGWSSPARTKRASSRTSSRR